MLEVGVCTWGDFKLAFEATTHRPASDLANKLKIIRRIWEAIGNSQVAKAWCNSKKRQPRALGKDGSAWADW